MAKSVKTQIVLDADVVIQMCVLLALLLIMCKSSGKDVYFSQILRIFARIY